MILTYEDRLADQIRAYYGLTHSNPIDMYVISNAQQIRVVPLRDDMWDGASGMYNADGPHPVIEINPNRTNAHQRFTFAHELGHHFLNHGTAARDTQAQLMARDQREMAANRFAAALLMPAQDVESAVNVGMSISQMANLFGVSEEAMGYRISNLGLYSYV